MGRDLDIGTLKTKAVGQTPKVVNVTTTSGEILAANPARHSAILTNDSDTIIYIALGQTALLNASPRVNAAGGVYTITPGGVNSKEAVNAIHGGTGNKRLTVQEFIWG